jgi:hypothetical protein
MKIVNSGTRIYPKSKQQLDHEFNMNLSKDHEKKENN